MTPLLAALLLWGGALVPRGSPSSRPHIEAARQQLTNGNPAAAEKAFRRALASDPANPELRRDLGISLLRQKKLTEAIRHLSAAARRLPDDTSVHYNLGQALQKAGRAKEAEAVLAKVNALHTRARNSNLAKGHNNTGADLLQQGRPQEAAEEFRRALHLNPDDPVAHYNHALALLLLSQTAEAVAELRTALKLDPTHADAHYYLGRALIVQGDPASALEPLETAVRLLPADPRAHNALAVALAKTRQLPRARAVISTALGLDPNNPTIRENHSCLAQGGGCALTP